MTGDELRKKVCENINSWLGAIRWSTKHINILNTYNAYTPLPRGYAVKPNDAWCATTVSAAWIKTGIAGYVVIECSCSKMIELAKAKGMWVEDDKHVPKLGEACLYDWDDGPSYSTTDDKGAPEHIGIVTDIGMGAFTVTEGNMGSSSVCGKRAMAVNGRYIRGFICPDYDKIAKELSGTTSSSSSEPYDKRLISAIQKHVGSGVDGDPGMQTFTDIACALDIDYFPMTVEIFGAPVIIGRNAVPFAAKGAKLPDYTNTINGSFYAGGSPCSILVQDGKVIQPNACHVYYGKPETVIFRTKNGKFGICKAKTAYEIPASPIWAVGGLGLLDKYNPTEEGFCKCSANGKTEDFSDVLRLTNHSMLGIKNNHVYLVYCSNMTAGGVDNFARKLGLEMAIMMDGGHVAGINGSEKFAKINLTTPQYYMIQALGK